jgi:hypothetical protein
MASYGHYLYTGRKDQRPAGRGISPSRNGIKKKEVGRDGIGSYETGTGRDNVTFRFVPPLTLIDILSRIDNYQVNLRYIYIKSLI